MNMVDAATGAWKMSLLQDHENVTMNVVDATIVIVGSENVKWRNLNCC
jgi:hypothetical protein